MTIRGARRGRNALFLALAVMSGLALAPRIARAQGTTPGGESAGVTIAPLFPLSSRSGITPLLIETDATAARRGLPADIDVLGNDYGRDAARVRTALRTAPGAPRQTVVPALLGYGGFVSIVPAGAGTDRPLASTSGFGSSPGMGGTLVAVMGLGTRIAVGLSSVTDTDVHAGPAHPDPTTGEPIWPASLLEWGGVHVVVAGAGSYLRAPPAARRALADFVLVGGTLVISPRTVADLNDPGLQEMIGSVREGEASPGLRVDLHGEKLTRASFGWVAPYGLGAVIVLRRDLSLPTWGTDPQAETDLQDLVRFVAGRGGAYLPAGELGGLSTLSNDYSSMASVLRPVVHLRGPLLPIAGLLFVYVIAVAVMLRLERRRGTPLRAFTRVPALAVGTAAAVIGIGYIARGHSDSARALVVFETAAGQRRALTHVFAGLTAGQAATVDVVPGVGEAAFATVPERGALGTERWTGDRMSVEGMRLGIWETAGVLIEGVRDLGGAVTITRGPGGRPRVHNGTRLRFTAAALTDVSVQNGLWRFGGVIEPGATMDADPTPGHIEAGEVRSIATFGSARATSVSNDALANTFMNTVCQAPPETVNRPEFWAMAERPAGMQDTVGPFRVQPGPVLLRVVVVDEVEPGARARPLPARTQSGSFSETALPPAVTSPSTGSGQAAGDTSGGGDGGVGADGGDAGTGGAP